MADKTTRTELAEAVRDLRAEVEQLRAERALLHCHGCACGGRAYPYPYPLTPQPLPLTPYRVASGNSLHVTTGALTSGGAAVNFVSC